MIIKYGIIDNNIDVTDICYNILCKNNVITIPESDYYRAKYFGDPLVGISYILTCFTRSFYYIKKKILRFIIYFII